MNYLNTKFRFIKIVVTLSCVGSLPFSRAYASPQDLFGLGARTAAMGMSGPASAEDYEAVYGAPGLLVESQKRSVTIGLNSARHYLKADTPTRELSLPIDVMKNISIGAVLPLPFGGILRNRLAFGLSFVSPINFLTRATIPLAERPQYPILASRVQSVGAVFGLGARITQGLYVGAGAQIMATVVGNVEVFVNGLGRVEAKNNNEVIATYAPIFSVTGDISSSLRAGITYRGELNGRFAIAMNIRDFGIPLPDLNIAGISQYDPAQIAGEVRWSSPQIGNQISKAHHDGWRILAGFLWRQWSKFPAINEPTVAANTNFVPPPSNAHNTLSPRIGTERSIPLTARAGFRLRGGYAFEPSPLPTQTGRANRLDSDRHVITAGLGLVFDESIPLQIDAFAQLHILVARTHLKELELVDSSNMGYPSVISKGSVWSIGLATGVQF